MAGGRLSPRPRHETVTIIVRLAKPVTSVWARGQACWPYRLKAAQQSSSIVLHLSTEGLTGRPRAQTNMRNNEQTASWGMRTVRVGEENLPHLISP